METYNLTGKLLKFIVYALILLTTLFLTLPIVFTILGSFSKYWGESMFGSGVTLDWYKYVFQYYGHTIGLTLLITFLTVLINVFIGSMAAYSIAMSRFSHSKWMKVVEELLTLPAAVPGIAIGLALAQSFPVMRSSGVLILIGHVIFTFPLMFRAVTGAIRSTDLRSIDECAQALGAGPFRRFFTVIFPAIRVSVFSGAINVFMTSLGEFNITFFLYTPSLMTFPVGMYESYASLRIEVGSAFTTLFLALAIPLSYILNRLNKSKVK
ncbi:ABC transporter permease [Alkalibaculum bacchi]|uniref:ABC transporter permease n=1 Tax=Alkalibaculum bacchi TaxID=645887 RepID=UPI0026EF1F9D|nr:ABC transporter permease subunit [Alkalibaculum bacchi]